MNQFRKGKAKNISARLSVSLFILITLYSAAFDVKGFSFHFSLTASPYDTIPVKKNAANVIAEPQIDSTHNIKNAVSLPPDSLENIANADTTLKPFVDTISFKTSKDSLDAPVVYHADDSMVFDLPAKKLLLYGKISTVKYVDNELTAPHIEFDQKTSLVKAILEKDSTGKVITYPTFNQGDFKSVSDTIVFNMKTGKGITKGTYTQQGEMYVYGEKIKKVNENVFYALNGRFTTCNLDTPHFAFVSKKIKFINKKWAFTGPVHPEIEGVPLPIVFPFGIYPLTQGRHSGVLAPTFTANEQQGLALEGLGYYKIFSPTWDMIVRGTLYSYGGWSANVNPRYFRKYRYTGNLGFDIQNSKIGFKGDPDYVNTKTINIQWSHNADTKARPGVNFSARVNAGSSRYNALVPNNPVKNFSNQLNSSITYAKVWKNKPYNISISANHNQNTVTKLINLNLPDVAFNVNTQYPFRRKEVIGKYKWYENIGVALNSNVKSLTSFYDTAGHVGKQIFDNLQWGASHNIPVTLSLPPLGPVQVSPAVSYQEKWYQERFIRRWNPDKRKLDTTITKGFYTARDMSFSLNFSTRLFGMFVFGKGSKIQAIRHEIRPTVGVSYKPNFNRRNFYDAELDSIGPVGRYSYYDRSIFGGFSEQKAANINFSIDNNIQMKVRNRKDTSEDAVKKITLLDGLGLTGSYNLLLDSFKLSILSLNARTNLFDKISITGSATFDPYQIDSNGNRLEKLVWKKNPFSLGRLLQSSISLQSRFQGGENSKGNIADNPPLKNINGPTVDENGYPLDEYQQEAAYISNNPGEFADFSIPWSIDFSYSLIYSKSRSAIDPRKYIGSLGQSVNWNASANLTPKWKVGMTGSYNISTKDIGLLTMFLSRDMHCWQMTINMSPIGLRRFFSISISPKSAILRDLKVNRTRSFYDQ